MIITQKSKLVIEMPDETKPCPRCQKPHEGDCDPANPVVLCETEIVNCRLSARHAAKWGTREGKNKAIEDLRLVATIRELQVELKRAHEIFENHVVDMRIALDCGTFPFIDAAYDLKAENKRLMDTLEKIVEAQGQQCAICKHLICTDDCPMPRARVFLSRSRQAAIAETEGE